MLIILVAHKKFSFFQTPKLRKKNIRKQKLTNSPPPPVQIKQA